MMRVLYICGISCLAIIIQTCINSENLNEKTPKIFYVDINSGDNTNPGDIESPFRTLDKAMEIVGNRVGSGIRSDKIYLRAGRYKKISATTLYRLELKGTPDDFAELSAMPCEPNTPGCVQRKSGKWYEKVVFDDAYEIRTPWEKVSENSHLWKTLPGYTRLEWTTQNLWPWTTTKAGFPVTDKDDTPETTLFTVAPYMVLQDGIPLLWADYTDSITEPGMRTYDHEAGELYVWPLDNKDPNTCKWESWYGGPEDFEIGTLHLDGEGRALFDGNLEFAIIRGFEFYMFNKIFEFHRRKYKNEAERVLQKHVVIEDNLFRYGWMHILLDANTVNIPPGDLVLPRYSDRANWTVRNNVYYRPSRECFQIHGDNHVFEYNAVIEHNGPWAGPAACVSIVNTRNTRNAVIRNNYIVGHGKNEWHRGSVFMIEVESGPHVNETEDDIYGGQTYENNLFEDISGHTFVLGKGGVRMNNITVRNNIFKTGRGAAAIQLSSPHWNLIIENNLFYDQQSAIDLGKSNRNTESYRSLPSAISIRNNIFANNRNTIDPKLLTPSDNSNLSIDNNLFYKNIQSPIGDRALTYDPLFRSPEQLDFRPKPNSTVKPVYNYFGPYPPDGSYLPGTDWWNIAIDSKNKSN